MPEPQKVSSTMSPRRVHVLHGVGDQCDGLDGRVELQLIQPTGLETVHARIVPDIGPGAAVTPELDVVEVRLVPDPEDAISSC